MLTRSSGAGWIGVVHSPPDLWQGLTQVSCWWPALTEQCSSSTKCRPCAGVGRRTRLGPVVLGLSCQFPKFIPEEHAEDGVGAQT